MPDLANIQGMICSRYAQPRIFLLLFRIDAPDQARAFIKAWLPAVRAADEDAAGFAGKPVLHFSFTWNGLKRILAGDAALDAAKGAHDLEPFFVDQTPEHPAVTEDLGFVGSSAPDAWWAGSFRNADIHLAVHAFFASDEQATAEIAALRDMAGRSGLHELQAPGIAEGALNGRIPKGGIVHFGYRDGLSTPDIDWSDQGPAAGRVDFREILTGYPNDNYKTAPSNPGAWRDFVKDGSFACVTWIRQDVAAFNRAIETSAAAAVAAGHVDAAIAGDWVKAKLLGRWPDGSPLVRHPDRPPPQPDLDNQFDYAADPEGLRCPATSHARVTNPRDRPMTFGNNLRFPAGPPRMIRRGFSYGPPLQGTQDDGVDRGLVGTFFCARINEQFYTVLRWIQLTNFSEDYFGEPYQGEMQNSLFGNRKRPKAVTRAVIPLANGGKFSIDLVDFIRYQGVVSLFMPGMAALRRLADRA